MKYFLTAFVFIFTTSLADAKLSDEGSTCQFTGDKDKLLTHMQKRVEVANIEQDEHIGPYLKCVFDPTKKTSVLDEEIEDEFFDLVARDRLNVGEDPLEFGEPY